MSHKEAIVESTQSLLGILEAPSTSSVSTRGYIKGAIFIAGVFNTQAKHLQASSQAAIDQALDLYIIVKKSLPDAQLRKS